MQRIRIGKIKKIHVGAFIPLYAKSTLQKFKVTRFIPSYVGYVCICLSLILSSLHTSLQNELQTSLPTAVETGYFSNARVIGLYDERSVLNTNDVSISSQASNIDKRVYVLDEYFKMRNSPLYGHAKDFVGACDQFGAPKDCIAVAAIARHETDLCKYYMSHEMRNCMGWGGGGEYRMRFDSYEQHIYNAYDVLVNQYGLRFLRDPSLMDTTFCGSEPGCTGWGERVKFFMREIDDFGVSLGVGRLSELDVH